MGKSKKQKHSRLDRKDDTNADEERRRMRESIFKIFHERAQSPEGAVLVKENSPNKPSRCSRSRSLNEGRLPRRHRDLELSQSSSSPDSQRSNSKRKRHKKTRTGQQASKQSGTTAAQHAKTARTYSYKNKNGGDGTRNDIQDVGARITRHRLTRGLGLFNPGKKSKTVHREPPPASESVQRDVEKTLKDILNKDHDIGCGQPVDSPMSACAVTVGGGSLQGSVSMAPSPGDFISLAPTADSSVQMGSAKGKSLADSLSSSPDSPPSAASKGKGEELEKHFPREVPYHEIASSMLTYLDTHSKSALKERDLMAETCDELKKLMQQNMCTPEAASSSRTGRGWSDPLTADTTDARPHKRPPSVDPPALPGSCGCSHPQANAVALNPQPRSSLEPPRSTTATLGLQRFNEAGPNRCSSLEPPRSTTATTLGLQRFNEPGPNCCDKALACGPSWESDGMKGMRHTTLPAYAETGGFRQVGLSSDHQAGETSGRPNSNCDARDMRDVFLTSGRNVLNSDSESRGMRSNAMLTSDYGTRDMYNVLPTDRGTSIGMYNLVSGCGGAEDMHNLTSDYGNGDIHHITSVYGTMDRPMHNLTSDYGTTDCRQTMRPCSGKLSQRPSCETSTAQFAGEDGGSSSLPLSRELFEHPLSLFPKKEGQGEREGDSTESRRRVGGGCGLNFDPGVNALRDGSAGSNLDLQSLSSRSFASRVASLCGDAETSPREKQRPTSQLKPSALYSSASSRDQASSSLYGRDQASSSAYGRDQASSSVYGRDQGTSSMFERDKDPSSVYGRDQASCSVYGRDQGTSSMFERDKDPSSVYGRDQASCSVYGRDQGTSSMFERDKDPSSVYGRDQASCSVYGRDQGTSSMFERDKDPSSVYGRDQASCSVYRRVQASSSVYGRVQASSSVYGRDQASSSVYGRDQASSYVYGRDQFCPTSGRDQLSIRAPGSSEGVGRAVSMDIDHSGQSSLSRLSAADSNPRSSRQQSRHCADVEQSKAMDVWCGVDYLRSQFISSDLTFDLFDVQDRFGMTGSLKEDEMDGSTAVSQRRPSDLLDHLDVLPQQHLHCHQGKSQRHGSGNDSDGSVWHPAANRWEDILPPLKKPSLDTPTPPPKLSPHKLY